MRLSNLKTLEMQKPQGIDSVPYFSWIIESDIIDTLQSAYQISVAEGDVEIWNTGKIDSRLQSFIEYDGTPLKSRTLYTWTVTAWDNHGNRASAASWFETALLKCDDWTAKWIESTIPREKCEAYQYGTQPPPVWFDKEVWIDRPIKHARLRATAYGTYVAFINGARPDDRAFAPEHTVYRSVLYYQTYDITSFLKEGVNELAMYVGDGWYFCPQSQPLGEELHDAPSILFQIEIEYTDGDSDVIASDGTEKCYTGEIVFSDIFRGEKQDANKQSGLKHPVRVMNYGYGHLRAQPMPPVRPMQLLPATSIYLSPQGETIIDFGQLICGRARIFIDEPKGTELTFEYFEIPQKDGSYFNSMYADQKDIYVSDGTPRKYEAYFTFHGFRYIRVKGMSNPKKEDFCAVLLTTEKENIGTFECSDERLNRLYKNVRWSQANNMLSIPTDCPSRERAGFTGDMQIYAHTALLNENMTPFLTSWLYNLAADQTADGVIPITVPFTKVYESLMLRNGKAFGDDTVTGVAGWGDAAVIVPYQMYRLTGNKIILKENYKTMKRWCDYIIDTAREKPGPNALPHKIDQYLWNTGFHFGEWLIPSQPEADASFEICKKSAAYIAPIFGYLSVKLFAEIANVLNRDEHVHYADTANHMKKAIQDGLMTDGRMPEELMGAYVLPIALDLVPKEYEKSFANTLVKMLEDNEYCLDTGFLTTPYLLDALVKIGRRDLALRVFFQVKQPSWLFEVNCGATAIWESWFSMAADGTPRMSSYDHYAFGCVDQWIFQDIVGIRCVEPGFKHFIIAPKPDISLNWCKRSFYSMYGEITVSWTKEILNIRVPCNTAATVYWKGREYAVGSGTHSFGHTP